MPVRFTSETQKKPNKELGPAHTEKNKKKGYKLPRKKVISISNESSPVVAAADNHYVKPGPAQPGQEGKKEEKALNHLIV